MTHEHGTYLGGIRDLAELRNRCRMEGDCWVWGGGLSRGKPSINLSLPDGTRTSKAGRRVGVLLAGIAMKPGQVVWQSPKCDEHLCVNPAHAAIGTRSGALLEHERRYGWKKAVHHARAGARIVALCAKVTPEQVAEIVASTEKRTVIAKKYGICVAQVYNIRSGKAWRGPIAAVNNSVFSWRGAA